ncbi:glycoside hydrolase family 20 protein [Streptomyces sp. 150FB]|uniref:beta-N-acetylhexosaminidase n=1 Tax=Streptomyces sp. 150FB TaxID=1576605 RepID=UPI001F02370B|nr:glycoside hydrolase family 20 protein [Streptomyces sp. 150FB]
MVLVASAAVACGGGGGGSGNGTGNSSSSASSGTPSASPSPSRSFPLSSAPTTIPSVRTHEAARGPGWKPAAGSAVVIAAGAAGSGLADEGRLLSTELKIAYRGAAAARAGDVELALAKGGAAESYTLTARDGRVRITGPDQSGVFYGTRTLKQALRADGVMPEGVVKDRPEWPQRGLNLDIARKFYTAGWIEDRLREMADLKLNEFGLHFSDDQGFRIESRTHPEIVSQQHLTQAEVRQILALASRLHITVVPEIDSPGHLGAVIDAHPELQLRNAQGVATKGAIDISNPASAKIVDDLDREFGKLFTGKYWHLGADEYQALVVADPQTSYPKLAALARKQFGASAKVQDLTTAWTNNRAKVVRAIGKKPKVWNDGLFAGGVVAADKDLQVEYWTGTESGVREPQAYLSEGRQVVNLNDKYLYYVLGQPNQFRYPTGQLIYDDWTPLVLRGSKAVPKRYSKQILGGRLAIWGDFPNAQTQDQVAAGIRMPLRALAQKTWAPGKPRLTWTQFKALAGRLGG